eukprot:TRINITY_DN67605_c6_g1_i2.p1 TRINITY_DN67605_c6_g1~~TRINITY_DN67605_c6_g1_i2.p1  ORF type:complete len:225 (-),score=108.04 TRINITY_DN67605_c6_g1_i2:52-726(-)
MMMLLSTSRRLLRSRAVLSSVSHARAALALRGPASLPARGWHSLTRRSMAEEAAVKDVAEERRQARIAEEAAEPEKVDGVDYPPEDGVEQASPRVQELAEQIVQLNLMEVSSLTQLLMKRLGISEAQLAPAAVAAPAAAAAAAPAEEEVKQEEQTEFTVKLEKFDAKQKIKVIKEVRALTKLGLKEAKELVDNAPSVIKSDATKEEAEQIKEVISKVGGEVAIE